MNNKRKMNLGLVVLSFVITTIAMILLPQSIPTQFDLFGIEKGLRIIYYPCLFLH